MTAHPLDQAILSSLKGRHAPLAVIRGRARRYNPAYAVFAAVEGHGEETLASLGALTAHGDIAMLEPDPPTQVPGVALVSQALGVQMVLDRLVDRPQPGVAMVRLGDADAPEMLTLAQLTEPGPFFEKTHLLGDFQGVRISGRLAAMAGERLKPDGFTEVSGVCTHPDFRSRGLAAALSHLVASRILERGDVPFLHAYADNAGAIALYEGLGFSIRRQVQMVRFRKA
jgi:predicted GNAT family acetyltransferase